ncbi:MAG: amidase [Polyangiaceae bacterium]|nr:amidase [Polyangiaceae bacterium]
MLDPATLLTESATRLAARIRGGEARARDIVDAHIEQLERANPRLNAVVETRFAEARAEADAADVRARAGAPAGPLDGVPCTIKECFRLTGMPNTSGLVARRGIVARDDATTVARLRAAGAVPLGVTNTSELCMWMESDNRVYGRTGSAHDPTRTAGGSSGGEGAIVGAGASPFGLGSDVGGSIRMPAFFNGVFGHKPTGGLVPNSGQYPVANPGPMERYVVTGPLARRAEDLFPLLRILAGPDGLDGGARALSLGDPSHVDLRGLVVLDVREKIAWPVSDELLAAQERAAWLLAARGAKVKRVRLPRLSSGLEIWSAAMSAGGGASFAELLGDGRAVRAAPELARWLAGRSPHTLPSIGLVALEKATKLLGERNLRALTLGRELKAELDELLDDRTVMLLAPHATVAPKHGHALLPPVKWAYTAVLNPMLLPITQVPLGLSRDGVPLGVQVIGGEGRDHVTIAVAEELERALGGWTMPAWLRSSAASRGRIRR